MRVKAIDCDVLITDKVTTYLSYVPNDPTVMIGNAYDDMRNIPILPMTV